MSDYSTAHLELDHLLVELHPDDTHIGVDVVDGVE